MFKHYKPSKAKRTQFAKEMKEIEEFCTQNGIPKTALSQVKTTIVITLP